MSNSLVIYKISGLFFFYMDCHTNWRSYWVWFFMVWHQSCPPSTNCERISHSGILGVYAQVVNAFSEMASPNTTKNPFHWCFNQLVPECVLPGTRTTTSWSIYPLSTKPDPSYKWPFNPHQIVDSFLRTNQQLLHQHWQLNWAVLLRVTRIYEETKQKQSL